MLENCHLVKPNKGWDFPVIWWKKEWHFLNSIFITHGPFSHWSWAFSINHINKLLPNVSCSVFSYLAMNYLWIYLSHNNYLPLYSNHQSCSPPSHNYPDLTPLLCISPLLPILLFYQSDGSQVLSFFLRYSDFFPRSNTAFCFICISTCNFIISFYFLNYLWRFPFIPLISHSSIKQLSWLLSSDFLVNWFLEK